MAGKLVRFEDMECRQEARRLTSMVYQLTRAMPFREDQRLVEQIRVAAVSVMNNIAEGFTSQSNTEFRRFLRYARRSAAEVQSCLYVALDQLYIRQAEFETVYEQAAKTRRLIDGLFRYLAQHARRKATDSTRRHL